MKQMTITLTLIPAPIYPEEVAEALQCVADVVDKWEHHVDLPSVMAIRNKEGNLLGAATFEGFDPARTDRENK